jgi:hypothetical protein
MKRSTTHQLLTRTLAAGFFCATALAGSFSAMADTISINFESMSTGSLPGGTDGRAPGNGQWWVPDNAASSGTVAANIGYGGTNGLVIGNRGNGFDGVIDNVHSPKLSVMTGESSVPSVGANGFVSSFLFRTVPTGMANPSQIYDFKVESWGRDRTTWLSFSNSGGDLIANYLGVNSSGEFTDNFGTYMDPLEWGTWYRVETAIQFLEGDNNDIVNVSVFSADTNSLVWSATDMTWEHYYRSNLEQLPNGNLITGVDALQFQARGNPAGDVAYVDNITYSAVPEPGTALAALGLVLTTLFYRRNQPRN